MDSFVAVEVTPLVALQLAEERACAGTYPDGLTPDLIDVLITECLPGPDPLTEALTDTRRLARAVLDATTLDRQNRRVVRRDLAAAVRALPARPQHTAPEAEVA